jgi:hypothetical protein
LGGSLTSDPGAVSWGANRIDVFVRGTQNGLFHKWWDGAQWAGWEGLGGSLGSGPDPTALGPGSLDVFYLVPAGTLFGRSYSGGWRPARSLNLTGGSAPGAVSSSAGISDVFVLGSGNSLYYTATPSA